jgi:hypothetical protein
MRAQRDTRTAERFLRMGAIMRTNELLALILDGGCVDARSQWLECGLWSGC